MSPKGERRRGWEKSNWPPLSSPATSSSSLSKNFSSREGREGGGEGNFSPKKETFDSFPRGTKSWLPPSETNKKRAGLVF